MAETLQEVPAYPDEAPHVEIYSIPIPKIAAKAALALLPVTVLPFSGTLLSAEVSVESEYAESATEYSVFEVVIFNAKGEEIGKPAASYSTKKPAEGTRKLKAFVAQALTLSATAAELVIEKGGVLAVKIAQTESKEIKSGVFTIRLSRSVRQTVKEQPGV